MAATEERNSQRQAHNTGGRADGNRKQRGSRALTAKALGAIYKAGD